MVDKRVIKPSSDFHVDSEEGVEAGHETPETVINPGTPQQAADETHSSQQHEHLNVPPKESQQKKGSRSPSPDLTGPTSFKIATQMARLNQLRRMKVQADDVNRTTMTFQLIQEKMEMLKQVWREFLAEHELIGKGCRVTLFRHPYMTDNMFDQAYNLFDQTNDQLHSLKSELHCREIQRSLTAAGITPAPSIYTPFTRAQLPEIKLKSFDGQYSTWPEFRDLFKSLVIDRHGLANVEKLHYLKSSLTGLPALLIKNIPLNDDSFESAWRTLTERYDDKERLIFSHIDSLLTNSPAPIKTAQDIDQLSGNLRQNLDALRSLNVPVQHWDYILITIVTKKLDSSLREAWEVKRSSSTGTTQLGDLMRFLNARARALESAHPSSNQSNSSTSHNKGAIQKKSTQQARSSHQASQKSDYPCDLCKGNHYIVACEKFRKLTEAESSTQTQPTDQSQVPAVIHHQRQLNQIEHSPTRFAVLLATAEALLITHHSATPVRLLIDPGSELTFISNNLVSALKLQRQHSTIPIKGIGNKLTIYTLGQTLIKLQSRHDSQSVIVKAHILRQLTTTLPTITEENLHWPELESLNLADPDYLSPRSVDIIVGADYYGLISKPSLIRCQESALIAQETLFGWVILGPIPHSSSSTHHASTHLVVEQSENQLNDLLQKFWTQDEIADSDTQQNSPDDESCELHYRTTHSRDHTGRYTVRIPLKTSPTHLGASFNTAYRCLKRTIQLLNKNNSYASLYKAFMKEYEDLGHMVKVTSHSSMKTGQPVIVSGDLTTGMTLAHDTPVSGGLRVSGEGSLEHSAGSCASNSHSNPYYLPHHGVLREDSETTKLRVVFNGSSNSSTGLSVNDLQYIGPKIQRDIADILIWIRQYRVVFSSDITKMYRQINVHKDDWDLQRILWIDDRLNAVPYQLTTVTYGTRSAPYLAIRTMLQLVEDEGQRFPLAKDPLIKGRYIDDIFGGSDSHEQLKEIASQVIQLCAAGGFPLAKWHSNSLNFIQHISTSSPSETTHIFENSSAKLLGLSWIPRSDTFKFNSKPPCARSKLTKRIILSETAQLYDPLGFLAPFIIRAKSLLQELWLSKVSWDDPIPTHLETKWKNIRQELTCVSEISIPRWLNTLSSSSVQLHGFSDASQLAMAAVIYIRSIGPDNKIHSTLVCSKTRVAPLKKLSIPRLELSAALLLAKLLKYVHQILDVKPTHIYLWTDSTVTLTWIQAHPSRWKEFVRNRVSAIQDLSPNSVWRHVPGKSNPADCASRGLTISQLQKHSLWWTGPQWLIKDESTWPTQEFKFDSQAQIEERPGLSLNVVSNQPKLHWEMLLKFSSLTRLLRVTAICFRVSQLIKKIPHSSLYYPLTPLDIERARVLWIKSTQSAYFKNELNMISSSRLPKGHALLRLTAFIDTQGIVRVGGRLTNSLMERDTMHPIILPQTAHLSKLIIADAHQKTMHGGTQATLTFIRRSYWILGGRIPVRSFIFNCMKCARQRGERAQQLMGQLPASRVTPSRPFSISGVDYAGPVTLKSWKGRGAKHQKGWMCVFVCFSTSAVHLELVSDYSSDSFIAAYRRFTGRRGICTTLYSDCGTTFIGADAQLKRLFNQGTQEFSHLHYSLTNEGTTWKFNPPAAPHMGGKWEAAVKSIKYHLNRTVGETALTFEEFNTLLIQIEAILNSRPLQPLTEDPDDLSTLTPAHFLIGEPLTAIPEPSLLTIQPSRLTRWQLLQQKMQLFWKTWSSQYLQRQLSISKWYHRSHQLKVGSLVLLTDERFPPAKWPLAKITQLIPGSDGLTRVVKLKTATTELTRPITKLAILPYSPHDDQLNDDQSSNDQHQVADGGENVET
ncbi:uncharacterized protein [Chelonus insularis]|uniref:uncharacterized protein n=1 Tax=Chelonus insularis TaxID=460826 RepID=UPI00158C9561|nr:uncharacterized protein LOC118065273 [Chelonus insularis]